MIVEKSVLAKLLTDKESIKVIDLDYLWFFDKKYREVAETLINLNGNYQSTNEIYMKIKESNPLTTVTYDFLDDLELSEVTSAGLEQEAKELQINYLNKGQTHDFTWDCHHFCATLVDFGLPSWVR